MTAIHRKKPLWENRLRGDSEFHAAEVPAESSSSKLNIAEKGPPDLRLEIPSPPLQFSKFFRSISQISSAFRPQALDEVKRLKDRRQEVQDFLREIHPPEARIGRRSAKELAKDPFVQTLNRVDSEVRDYVAQLLRDQFDPALDESPYLEKFIRKYFEVREELLEKDPSYLRQRSLEAAIQRIGQWEAEEDLLARSDTIRLIREDLEAEIADIEAEEESRRLADAEYSADLGDGEADEPTEAAEEPPSEVLAAARQKLAIFNGLLEELELLNFDSDPDWQANLEDREGIARDFSAYEEEWVWKQLESRLEAVERMDGKHPKVREFQTALEALRENPEAKAQDYLAVLAKAEEAALWTSVEARIDLYSEMHDSAGMTDGIIHLGKKALRIATWIGGGALAYEASRENSESDIDGASAYLEMQTRYIAVHRALTEGDYAKARKLFVRLENSQEHAGMLEGYKDSQRINQCTVTAAIVTASAATAGVATELIGGAAAALGMTRGLSLLKFGTHAAAFTVAERGYTSWVYDKNYFDPRLSFSENAQGLGWEMAMNAGMFAFLGRAFQAFEKHLILPLARTRALAKIGRVETSLSEELIRAERDILLNQLTTGIPLRLGRFGAELLAFGQWEAIAQNLELNRKNLQEGEGFDLVFPVETLFSPQAWEERFVFLITLKAGGLLAAPLSKPIQERLQQWLAKPNATLLSAALPEAPPAEPTAETPRKTLGPQDYLSSLEGKVPLGSGGGMAAFDFAGDPGLILLLPKGARWEGNKIEFRDAEFYRSYLKETLDHYDAVAHLTYRDRPLAPRIEGLLSDGEGNLAGYLMEKVAGKNLYELIQEAEISTKQMKAVEALLREQLSILHENGLAHGDPEFLNVLVQLGETGEVIDARFIDFTRPKSDKYEPTHGTPQYDLDVMAEELKHYWKEDHVGPSPSQRSFRNLPEIRGGHDGPQKPKAEEVHQYVEMYENGEEAAGLRGLVELAEQGLPEAVIELLLLKLGPNGGDRGKIQEAMASIRVEALAERAPEDYMALRALLEIAASDNEAARNAAAAVPLTALREMLARDPEEGGLPNLNADLSDFLWHGNREAAEILFGKYRHEIHPEHLANWEEKILREGRLNYPNLSPQSLLQLAREGRKDVLFGLLEMAHEQASPVLRGMLNLIFFEETASILIERIRWLRGEMGPTTVLEHDLQSTPADHVRRVARFAPYRPDAQRALLELANAGHPEALRELAELPLNGVFEDGQEVTLFAAEPVAFGLAAWKFIGLRDGQLTFKKVRMHASEPPATLRLSGIQEPVSVLKPGAQYYFLEKNDADPLGSKTDPSPFALPFMIFGPGTLLMRGLSWLWKSLRPERSEVKPESMTYESSPAQGWAWNEAGLHYFEYPRSLHLTDVPSAFSEKKYGRWRALGFQVWKGKSILLLQKQRPPTEPENSDATQEYMYFESSEPLRRMMKEDGKIYLVGKEVSLPLDADLYFYPGVSGGSDPKSGEVKRRIAQRIFAGNRESVPLNSRVPRATALRETGGREFLLKTRLLTEAEADVSYSAILLRHQAVPSEGYRQAAEIRLTFGIFENSEDYRYLQKHGVPRRSLTFVATREEAEGLGFEYDAAGKLLSQSQEKNWVLKEKAKPGAIRGGWRVSDPRPDPEFLPLQTEYRLFDAEARLGSVVMLGRGRAPAGFKKQFIPISDPVVRRRHLLLRRRSAGEVEIQAIPPRESSLDRENRKAFWVEMEGAWLPLPADLPYVLEPGQRFALGHVTRPPGETSQALVFRLSADGNSLLLD